MFSMLSGVDLLYVRKDKTSIWMIHLHFSPITNQYWGINQQILINNIMEKELNPFPHTTILQQTTLNLFCQNIENLNNWMDNLWQKVEKHCGKRRNCTFCAISSFVTKFSKSRLLQRRLKASIWGKGLTHHELFVIITSHIQHICSKWL